MATKYSHTLLTASQLCSICKKKQQKQNKTKKNKSKQTANKTYAYMRPLFINKLSTTFIVSSVSSLILWLFMKDVTCTIRPLCFFAIT